MRALSLCLLLSGCGDALFEADYRGVPLHRFSGQVTSVGSDTMDQGPLRAAIFWSLDGTTRLDGELVEQDAISVKVRFPGVFEINVFDGPPALDWARPKAPWRVGMVLVYEDCNRDDRGQPDERVGGASHLVLIYAERDLAISQSPFGRALTAGYHTLRVPMACEPPEPEEAHEAKDCGVPIGAACGGPADCGVGGLCVTRDTYHVWPGGYCMLPVSAACVPSPARPLTTDVGAGERALYHKACDGAEDCRLDDGYACSEEGVCLPGAASALVIGPDFAVAPLCAPEHEEG